jgi:hypothetical protein
VPASRGAGSIDPTWGPASLLLRGWRRHPESGRIPDENSRRSRQDPRTAMRRVREGSGSRSSRRGSLRGSPCVDRSCDDQFLAAQRSALGVCDGIRMAKPDTRPGRGTCRLPRRRSGHQVLDRAAENVIENASGHFVGARRSAKCLMLLCSWDPNGVLLPCSTAESRQNRYPNQSRHDC